MKMEKVAQVRQDSLSMSYTQIALWRSTEDDMLNDSDDGYELGGLEGYHGFVRFISRSFGA